MCILSFDSWLLQRINIKKSIMKWTKALATIIWQTAIEILDVLYPLVLISAVEYGRQQIIL